jgi:hypothetical protein
MGRELAEGKAHLAEAAAALARSQADDMRTAYQELEDHCLVGPLSGVGRDRTGSTWRLRRLRPAGRPSSRTCTLSDVMFAGHPSPARMSISVRVRLGMIFWATSECCLRLRSTVAPAHFR